MSPDILRHILTRIQSLKIAVIGDFAIDFYFQKKEQTGDFSVETNKEVHWAQAPQTSLGGAGNVAKNLATLGVPTCAYGLIGSDIFGRDMDYHCQNLAIQAENLRKTPGMDTPTYSKPMAGLVELNRIDFGTQEKDIVQASQDLVETLIQQLSTYDWVIINEQFRYPLLNQNLLEKLQKAMEEKQKTGLADLRSLGKWANNVLLKVNESELAHVLNIDPKLLEKNELVPGIVQNWVNERQQGALVTLGDRGLIYADKTQFHWQPGIPVRGPIDTVGAGDMVVAGFSAARAAGASIEEACEFATLCAHISIHKLGETGAATPQEILDLNQK
ncbi:bifunctional heptose 7-phosphate kinase/heptose 1-phosphate adenyltransferase [Aquirufa rosea]|uniref:Carbohydrate kinase n=1 Tax=Aquirufa rosea TaxID=2509241 RepID=A0A4Q1BXI9_9BACT|nr:PfkB family carbohydrate kinase [Aquirufa rosea]RXK47120.1 carbohydrate kinase [Aquirufa rosea]